jgi:carboxybiotin decarboxylase
MWAIGVLFIYLAVAKKYEPLILLPIGFGIFLVNFPASPLMGVGDEYPELLRFFYRFGLQWQILPPLIFLGVGAMTDFGPLLSNPKTLIIGAGAQLGMPITFVGAIMFGMTPAEAAAIGIIGGADGPTTIFLAQQVAPHMLGAAALAAYSYMAMVPIIQPPIMKALTTLDERKIVMKQVRVVSHTEKIIFPILLAGLISLLVPAVMPLIAMFTFGNLMRESGVVNRLVETTEGALVNIVTIFLGIAVGATMVAEQFLTPMPLFVLLLGLVSFVICTAGGILTVKIMNLFLKPEHKMNPLIGSAGVSAVPMAARVSQALGQEANPQNFLIMHALGPNLAGVVATATAAGLFLALFG